MIEVFTTAGVIDRLACATESCECDWLNILNLQGDIYYSGRNYNWEEDPDDPWFIASQRGHDFINREEFIEGIKEHPESVLDHPDAVFILDVDSDFALRIENDYGVICQPASTLDSHCRLTGQDRVKRVRKPEKTPGCATVIRKTWKDILGNQLRACPSNAMVLVERNFFSHYDKMTGELFGIENLRDLLDTVLPEKLKCEYQVLIIYQDGQHPTEAGKPLSEMEFIRDTESRANEVVKGIRGYPISVKLLSVSDPKRYFDPVHRQLFNDTHDRRLVTNYYLIEASWSLAPFYTDRARTNEKITMEYLFSRLHEEGPEDLAVHEKNDILNMVKGFMAESNIYRTFLSPLSNRLVRHDVFSLSPSEAG